MATAKVKIGVAPSNFAGIANLAANVIAGLTGNPLNFPAPNPSIATLTTDLATLNAAIATWGPVGNRGSHVDYNSLLNAASVMRNDLLLEADYVGNLVDPTASRATQAAFILTSGFSVKNLPMPQGVLGPPIGLTRHMSDAISEDTIVIRWSKPTGLTSPNNVKQYLINLDGTVIGFTTKTSFNIGSVMFLPHGSTFNIFVIALNADGESPPSNILTIQF